MAIVSGRDTVETNVDTVNTNAALVKLNLLSAGKVYPTQAAGVLLTAGGDAWAFDGPSQIVPGNTITTAFTVNQITVESFSATGTYEIILLTGGLVELGRVRVGCGDVTVLPPPLTVYTPMISANTAIYGVVCCSVGGSTIRVSLGYTPLV